MYMSGTVFIDLKKVFDTIDHSILCLKLWHYGVKKKELSCFEYYLSNRKQYSSLGEFDSDVGIIETGVPQGSCLGPLLFLLYIDNLPKLGRFHVCW